MIIEIVTLFNEYLNLMNDITLKIQQKFQAITGSE
jgi:hypothetical protein